MSLSLKIDRDKKRSLYQQIADQIKSQIQQGHLPTGTRLPTVRQLAQQLKVTRLTVHNAYTELQADGWIESVVGRGTFVAETQPDFANMADISRHDTFDGFLTDMVPLSRTPGLRSLAFAYPDENLLPLDDFWEGLNRVRADGTELMQYGLPQGDPHLRVELTKLLEERGLTVTPNDVMITSGTTQGLSMVAQKLAKPGDTVLVELPTYHGFSTILSALGIQPLGVPRTEEGVRLDIVERLIVQRRPRFFYLIPNFHNPTGGLMSEKNRKALLEMAKHYGLLLIEDDVYGRLSYQDTVPLPLKALDTSDLVVYIGGFSKDLLPAVRIGYVVAPSPLREQLPVLRGAHDLFGATLFQRVVADYLRRKKFKPHLQRTRPIYKERRDTLLKTLVEWMPDYVTWTRPEGGFTCWLNFPDDRRFDDLYHAALSRGVGYSPGSVFMAQPDGQQHMRLCFGNQPSDVIAEGIATLSELIRERMTDRPRSRRQPDFNQMPLV